MQMKKWSMLSNVIKYVQYNQYPIGHNASEVKAPKERYDTKMYKML